MSTYAETRTEAWQRRADLDGQVDFTMMYIAHDAFSRDIARLITAAEGGQGLSSAAVGTWRRFSKQLHVHHTAEDQALWPRLAAAVAEPSERRVLEEMEAEHAAIDPWVGQIARLDGVVVGGRQRRRHPGFHGRDPAVLRSCTSRKR